MAEEKKVSRKDTIKKVLAAVGGAGCWEILSNAISHTTPSGIGFLEKALVSIGSIVVTGMVREKATEYIDEMVDDAFEKLDKIQKEETSEEVEAA